ncbi:NAD-dependent epimerase/dehydratase family protein [Psychroserpens sp.]|uniref:polysaccharide biosynthesis C-terminal domain-containing protein n=1 Tax=Psychroserpens sp. TaxID=2020870 RepID=UPI001B160A79|nr:NAD-dependent epimerase/dehydratase family protein [Psychroserpens sp.]MBO6606481.1 NAD-dependent epimerase/dehydratase family protein [Psychroserpens sp.]MBO6631122.1 NAD-dependent epimerase/dehydratase family protein [Psychroserpens sp.]MBO6653185.1 NAD-dependent epimerase/dehydratase family protein [Psychroserpens sp.]MBO6680787.1 NAD-dependent epimerase/dehydratase family protein [Psychroserpens sp.]MBO6750255.1 NAD-dependent epimerase/dehydratase family protein [Psychroserpens sp.]
MIKVGITGQAGFIGNHLYTTLSLDDTIELIPFERHYFDDDSLLQAFVSKCDCIVHLAAMNRHVDPEVIYHTNVQLAKKLANACMATQSKAHIVYSSSIQELNDNLYGKSKKEGKEILSHCAIETGGKLTSLSIPNVFGPFGKPNYNSFIATFCHKLTHNETPEIHTDAQVKLIYINELVAIFISAIKETLKSEQFASSSYEYVVPHTSAHKVSEILELLISFKDKYLQNGVFPSLDDPFEKALFNTFRCYIPTDHYPVSIEKHTDPRGAFVEIAKANSGGQFSFSTTVPGITRGNHFHTRKAERFAVISGKALIQLRRIGTNEVIDYYLDGENPAYVDMPIWYTHNIKNIGDTELVTLFWINEPYNPEDADTYFENV